VSFHQLHHLSLLLGPVDSIFIFVVLTDEECEIIRITVGTEGVPKSILFLRSEASFGGAILYAFLCRVKVKATTSHSSCSNLYWIDTAKLRVILNTTEVNTAFLFA
jgi:hypothetical protein